MEKKFIAPEMEVIRFETADIIVASGGSEDQNIGNE